MTPFQAIKATFYMLLAKAREPIQERELAPAPMGSRRQPSGATRPVKGHLKMTQTGRRKTDSPFQHQSFTQRIWTAVAKWATRPNTGAKV
jgi:hypothetical protein